MAAGYSSVIWGGRGEFDDWRGQADARTRIGQLQIQAGDYGSAAENLSSALAAYRPSAPGRFR